MDNAQKKLQLRKATSLALPALFYAALILPLATNAQAGCSRADIDHYLEKGFTPAQITTLCGDNSAPQEAANRPETPGQLAPQTEGPASYQSTSQVNKGTSEIYRGQESRSFFGDAIEGYDVVLTTDTLSYTRKKCYEYGKEDLFGFRPEVCPEVRYHINLTGLEILKSGQKYLLFGPPEITVKSQISREVLSGLEKLDAQGQEEITKMIGTGNEELLPIRQGIPKDRVEAELKKVMR